MKYALVTQQTTIGKLQHNRIYPISSTLTAATKKKQNYAGEARATKRIFLMGENRVTRNLKEPTRRIQL
jgi:hypothetical protein